jgi:hypothetical protein
MLNLSQVSKYWCKIIWEVLISNHKRLCYKHKIKDAQNHGTLYTLICCLYRYDDNALDNASKIRFSKFLFHHHNMIYLKNNTVLYINRLTKRIYTTNGGKLESYKGIWFKSNGNNMLSVESARVEYNNNVYFAPYLVSSHCLTHVKVPHLGITIILKFHHGKLKGIIDI